ncbi:MAG TPA: hypothetical protein VEY07_04275 [Thermoplasmata archaeon]|nr:hypothetical protein [Thermoplasmata archaeon]
MSRAGASTPAAGVPTPSAGEANSRPQSNDLGLELYRQRTLLQIMTARLRETAGGVDRGTAVDLARVRRALDVHHRFLLEVHHSDAERVARAIAKSGGSSAGELLRDLEQAKQRAEQFEEAAAALIAKGVPGRSDPAHRLSQLFQAEAERIDQFQLWEADHLHAHLDAWIPRPTQARLLGQLRKFDSARVDAEIALISWASQIHPSAD